ncbi:MAG: LLM class flavin-dependent oxidoreductase [Dehalococcoidia bacterium]|nr:LLM class flavin-dependent oxidoreductase [Dehalococcoidia bacterium]
MKVAVGLAPVNEDWAEAAAFIQEAERLGADSAWSAETWGHDAATPIGYMAAKTSRIKLGTGIIQAAARTPANIAMISMALASMSNDRFILGLGASGPQVVEGWHGVPFKGAVQRIRETVEIVRMATRGERVAYNGKIFTLPLPGGEGKALKTSARPRDVPIYLATLSPKSLEMTGEIADGWIGTSFIPEHASVFFERIASGAKRAGKQLTDIDLQVAAGVIAFGDDLERLIAPRRPGLAFTLGAMGSRQHNFYNDAYKRAGYTETALEVQRLWLEGKREEAAANVPDEMVTLTNLLGTDEMVKARIRAHKAAGVNTMRVQPEGKTAAERIETLGRFMELVKEVG